MKKYRFFILILFISLNVNCFGQQPDTSIFINPQILPTFKYDTCSTFKESLKRYFMDNYKMPEILVDNGYNGSIYLEVVIEKDSTLSNIKLLRGIHEPLDKSVIETVKIMPKWIPGINNDNPVKTRVVFPISIHWLYGNF